jgi:RNase P protein component
MIKATMTRFQLEYAIEGLHFKEATVAYLVDSMVLGLSVADTAVKHKVSRQLIHRAISTTAENLEKQLKLKNQKLVLTLIDADSLENLREFEKRHTS